MPAILLRCCIALGSQTGGICHTGFLELSGCTEVNEHDLAIRPQHNIGRFHIPVDNRWFSGMQVGKHITKLFCPLNDIRLILCPVLTKHFFQGTPFYVVHNNEETSVSIDYVNNTWQIWIIQFFQQICLYD